LILAGLGDSSLGRSSGLFAPTSSRATWADKFRDANTDIEISSPDLDAACFNHPIGTTASEGSPADCVVDKIQQFAAELANPAISQGERIAAPALTAVEPKNACNFVDLGPFGVLAEWEGMNQAR
jgi:hypothetical protein